MTSQTQSTICICGRADCQIPYGLCHCKCGGTTNISPANYKTVARKGEPRKFIDGHQRKVRLPIEDAIPFKIDGKYCRFIPLSMGLIAIVTQERYVELMEWKWSASRGRYTFYAVRHYMEKGKIKQIAMHQQIWRVGEKEQVDHANGNGLDNRDDNLRPASDTEQRINSKMMANNTSGHRGISWDKKWKKWRVRIQVHGKEIWLGRYADYDEAVRVREEAEIKYFGGFKRCA